MRLAKWSDTDPVDWLTRQALRDIQRLQDDAAFVLALEEVRPWNQAELESVQALRERTRAPRKRESSRHHFERRRRNR